MLIDILFTALWYLSAIVAGAALGAFWQRKWQRKIFQRAIRGLNADDTRPGVMLIDDIT